MHIKELHIILKWSYLFLSTIEISAKSYNNELCSIWRCQLKKQSLSLFLTLKPFCLIGCFYFLHDASSILQRQSPYFSDKFHLSLQVCGFVLEHKSMLSKCTDGKNKSWWHTLSKSLVTLFENHWSKHALGNLRVAHPSQYGIQYHHDPGRKSC